MKSNVLGVVKSKLSVITNHPSEIHSHKDRQHGSTCGCKRVVHGDHIDYVHDGHFHRIHGNHVDECAGPSHGLEEME